jgi:hypothetical protein
MPRWRRIVYVVDMTYYTSAQLLVSCPVEVMNPGCVLECKLYLVVFFSFNQYLFRSYGPTSGGLKVNK